MKKEKPLDDHKVFEDFFINLANVLENTCDSTLDSLAKLPNESLLQAVINFFTADDWSFVRIEGESVLHVAFQGRSGIWNCYAMVREIPRQVAFYSICPADASENKRQLIAEFLTRANHNMILGNFELDFNNGEIRYKTSIDVTDDRLSFALIQQLVHTNVTVMDKYLPGIQAVLSGEALAVEAIQAIEGISLDTPSHLNIPTEEESTVDGAVG